MKQSFRHYYCKTENLYDGILIVYLVSSFKTCPDESLESVDLLDEEGVQQGGHAPELLLSGDKPFDVEVAEV